MEKFDLVIHNALMTDTKTGDKTLSRVCVKGGFIARVEKDGGDLPAAASAIDAKGDLLLPGIIDFHAHLFAHGSGFGLDADRLLEEGASFAADMGTAGVANFPALYECDLSQKKIRTCAFLNISPIGQPGRGINEPLDDSVIDVPRMKAMLDRYPGVIRGIKVRVSRNIVRDLGLEPLKRAVKIGEELNLPVCVHTTNPPTKASDIADILRPGDIYSHTYMGSGNTIIGEDGHVEEGILAGQKRGVIMEVGNGRMNFNFPVAEKAIADGLLPDIISSDATPATFHKAPEMWDLPTVMAKFMMLGVPFKDVVRSVAETPAAVLGLGHVLGKIAPGYAADMAILHLEEGEFVFGDSSGNKRTGHQMLYPVRTIRAGRTVFEKED